MSEYIEREAALYVACDKNAAWDAYRKIKDIPAAEIIKVIGQEPLFGHRSGKKMNTHWMCFMKFKDGDTE